MCLLFIWLVMCMFLKMWFGVDDVLMELGLWWLWCELCDVEMFLKLWCFMILVKFLFLFVLMMLMSWFVLKVLLIVSFWFRV